VRAVLLPLAWVLSSCGGGRSGQGRALDRFEEGRRALDEGRAGVAAEAFARAAELDPGHGLLRSWQALALARAGRIEEAIALLEEPGRAGGLAPFDLYNLGAWNARLGREEAALAWLEQALAADPALRTALGEDADLAWLRERELFRSRIGGEKPTAAMLGEEGAILAGEPYDMELLVGAAGDASLALAWGQPLPEGFALRRAVDTLSAGAGGGSATRSIEYSVRCTRAGEGTLGPWTLRIGELDLEVPAVPWQAILPEGIRLDPPELAPPPAPEFWTPREALAGLAAPAALERFGRLLLLSSPGDQVEIGPGAVIDPPVELELRHDEQVEVQARLWTWAPAARQAEVRIRRAGATLLETRVRRGRR